VKEHINRLTSLSKKSKRLLVLGITFALLAALPLFVWAILTQRFDIRKRAATGEPTPPPVGTSVNWQTPHAYFQADDFRIVANGKTFYANEPSVSVHSDPGSPTYTTLEIDWQENGVEMRLYIYFNSDGQKWWSPEIRIYNGKTPPDWIVFKERFFESNLGSEHTQAISGGFVQMDPNTGKETASVHFSNLRVQAFTNLVTPTPITCQRVKPDVSMLPQSHSGNPGERKDYTIRVKNNDSANCPITAFELEALLPSQDWGAEFSKPILKLLPGGIGTSLMGITPSLNPIAGGNPIGAHVSSTTSIHFSAVYATYVVTRQPPAPQTMIFRIKFAGVNDEAAEGAKAKIRFVRGTTNLETSPIEFAHMGDGIYEATITLNTYLSAGSGYTIYVKGEKHLSRKFCSSAGQSQRCIGGGNIVIPTTGTPVFDFTGLALEPGDLPPQDGKADSADFTKIISLFGKLCSDLTENEKAAADLDYNGCINIRDAFFMRKTLETKFDEY
jgi:hypothetical protein